MGYQCWLKVGVVLLCCVQEDESAEGQCRFCLKQEVEPQTLTSRQEFFQFWVTSSGIDAQT